MGLGHLQAVPVDVHVRRLAYRDYGVGGAAGSLTAAAYQTVGQRHQKVHVMGSEVTFILQGRCFEMCLELLLAGLKLYVSGSLP